MTLATPPFAPKKPHTFSHHGLTVADDYAWLRDPGYPEVTDKEVIAHLEAENAWFESRMAPHRPAVEMLFKEMRGRIKEADKSVPQKDGSFKSDNKLLAEMIAYCEQDVRAMRSISSAMRDLSADELADYHVNERINDRGVKVDVALCNAAIKYASAEVEEIQEIVCDVTKGEIKR